ncbi:MAG: TonB-dependent receptor, partial [Sphingomonas sp.]
MRRDSLVAAAMLAAIADPLAAQSAPLPAPPPAPQPAPPVAAPAGPPAPAPTAQPTRPPLPRPPRPASGTGGGSGGDISDEADIVVQGTRDLPGAVVGDIPPEQQLSPADIHSYGVNSVAELLTELAPQTRSGRGNGGPPVVLLNGKRISGFQEIRDLPTEAIARVDILPEEVALKYGYTADQRVVNIVLRRRFRAETLQFGDRFATDGGRNSPNPEGDILRIRNDNRFTAHLEYEHFDALTEAERNIVEQTPPGQPAIPNLGQYRTLLPATDDYTGNFVYARPIGKTQASLNGRIDYNEGAGLQGAYFLPSGDVSAIHRRTTDLNTHVGLTANGNWSIWRWNLTSAFDRDEANTTTDGPFASRAHSLSTVGRIDGLVNGQLADLPAGKINVAVHGGGQIIDFASNSSRNGVTTTGSVGRNIANGQLNVDVPLTSRSKHVLGAIGDLSANFNVAGDDLSDFGT